MLDSEITIIDHGDFAMVKFPYRDFKDFHGGLAFKTFKVTDPILINWLREVITKNEGFPMNIYDLMGLINNQKKETICQQKLS